MQTITKLFRNFLTIAILILSVAAMNAAAATFTVNQTGDAGDLTCDATCTLRDAIDDSNATADADTITFDPSVFSTPQTITLAGTALTITGNATNTLTINGPGANLLTVSGNDVSRVFVISLGTTTVSISGLTVTRGNGVAGILSGDGGGINNGGILTLTNLVVTNNTATGSGGGIRNASSSGGRLNVINCVISNNVINNSTGNGGNGGGIGNASQNSSGLTITNSTISGNSTVAGGGSGGGIFTNGPINMSGSTVSGNSAGTNGGGISFSEVFIANISNSTISGNSATGTFRNGGGIDISNSEIAISNSTISGNSAGNRGGGINILGQCRLTSSTVVNNTAPSGGGVFNSSNRFNVGNTIIANNSGNTTSPDVLGEVNSLGYNLIEDTTGTTFTGTTATNITGQDPQLFPLANNGGPTQTHALMPGSPAIDKGSSFGLTTDQRGAMRPIDNPSIPNATGGDGADIGAFEVQAPTAASVTISGRVSAGKRGVARVVVYLTDQNGSNRTALTNQFGYYRFDEVEVGQTYIFNAYSKRYQFTPQVVTINDSLDNLNFTVLYNKLGIIQ